MPIDEDLLTRLDLEGAARRELVTRYRLLPRRGDRAALAKRSDDIWPLLRDRYRTDKFGDRADLVFVEKSGRGRRPVSEMSLADRVIYRALVDLIRASLPQHLQSRAPNDEFKRYALSVPHVKYVSKTDITSFYEYVDHETLADELEAQTGEALAIAALMDLLHKVMGRRVGLPQVHWASDILGDTYIDIARRRLRRAGYDVVTYSDDFRIASPTLGSARQALEACAKEARALGLTLNESKTFTYTTPNYQKSLQAFSDAEEHLFENVGDSRDLRLIFTDGYGDLEEEEAATAAQALSTVTVQAGVLDDDALEDVDSDAVTSPAPPDPAQKHAAQRAWRIWQEEEEGDEHQSTTQAAITESLLGRALPILGQAGDTEPLDVLSALLRYEPALTPQISGYLTALAQTGQPTRAKIREALDELVGEAPLSSWQKIWLADAAGSVHPTGRDHPHYAWLRECVADPDPALAATAAAALGRLRRADLAELTGQLDRMGPAWRDLVLWGIALQDPLAAASASDGLMDRILLETVADAAP